MRPPPSSSHVAAVLRDLRSRTGLSQEKLAEKAGFHRTYVGQLERAERNPTIASLTPILDTLGVSWEEFGRTLDEIRGRTD